MMRTKVTVHVPATSANLGPGFDCLGIALDLWNVIEFSVRGERLKCVVEGQGEGSLPAGRANVIFQGVERLYALANRPMPAGMEVHCRNDIPVGSGMGSSAAAALAGLMGANALLDDWVDEATLLNLCAEMEGHGDNAAAAFYGGCRLVA